MFAPVWVLPAPPIGILVGNMRWERGQSIPHLAARKPNLPELVLIEVPEKESPEAGPRRNELVKLLKGDVPILKNAHCRVPFRAGSRRRS